MEIEAENFISKPNNNQKKAKTDQKLLNSVSAHATAALFETALAFAPYRSIRLPGAPRLVSVIYVSTFLHFYTSTLSTVFSKVPKFERKKV
jgi:hypothetical protein